MQRDTRTQEQRNSEANRKFKAHVKSSKRKKNQTLKKLRQTELKKEQEQRFIKHMMRLQGYQV
jgi:hypothetical protein